MVWDCIFDVTVTQSEPAGCKTGSVVSDTACNCLVSWLV